MKRWIVAALVVAGCAPQAPEERPLPPGMVTVATFTGDVDLSAGTLVIRAEPTPAGASRGVRSLVITDSEASVANVAGTPWFNESTEHGCGEPVATWGADVQLSSLLGETYLGGVYAEITAFGGSSGNQACNSAEAPEGMNPDGLGLWSYGTVAPGGTRTQTWTFNYVGGGYFRFSGRIVAVKEDSTALNPPIDGVQAIGDTGTGMVFASDQDPVLEFFDYAGASTGTSISLTASATAVAPDVAGGRIFVITENAKIGVLNSDGTGVSLVLDGGTSLGGLVVDPTVPGQAWYRNESSPSYIRTVTAGVPFPVLGEPVLTPFAPTGMAIGPAPDKHLYVTSHSGNRIMVYTTGASGGTPAGSYAIPAGCREPGEIILGPDGDLWFTSEASNRVCRMTTAGGFLPIVDVTVNAPGQLVIGPDGNVWVTSSLDGALIRVDTSGPGYRVDLPFPSSPLGLAVGGGYLWTTANPYIFRAEP